MTERGYDMDGWMDGQRWMPIDLPWVFVSMYHGMYIGRAFGIGKLSGAGFTHNLARCNGGLDHSILLGHAGRQQCMLLRDGRHPRYTCQAV